MIKSGEYNMSMNGSVHNVSGFGLSDAHIDLTLYNGHPPYKVVTSVDGVIFSTLENIPDDENGEGQVHITGLPQGKYKLEMWDSLSEDSPISDELKGDKSMPQYLPPMTDWNVVSPPFVTLNGSVNPLGKSILISFEVGETTEYGHVIQYGTPTPGNNPILINLRLSALTGKANPTSFLEPGKTYHYRLKGIIQGMDPIYSNDETFTTPESLPILKSLPATDIS